MNRILLFLLLFLIPIYSQSVDMNDDGKIDLVDLSIFQDEFRSLTPNVDVADFNGDNEVDLVDLSILVDALRGNMPPDTTGGEPLPGHEHFESQIQNPGVVTYNSWRTQANIDRETITNRSTGPGIFYDSQFDGARLTFQDGKPLNQLRHPLPRRIQGSFWSQHEMMFDPILFTAAFNGCGSKVFRWQDDEKGGDRDERILTANVGYGSGMGPIIYHRDGGAIEDERGDREVRFYPDPSQGANHDRQPGGSTECWRKPGGHLPSEPHPTTKDPVPGVAECFRWQPGEWTRVTYHFDIDNDRLHIWARNLRTNIMRKIVDFAVPKWNSRHGMTVIGVWMHSTSRLHNDDEWKNKPTAHIYARNLIVSLNPITP